MGFLVKGVHMPVDVHRVRYTRPSYTKGAYHVLMKTLQTSLVCESSDIAQYRLHVLHHYYQYGCQSTRDAFRVTHTTLYRWKHMYEVYGRNAGKLIPHSTAPTHVRIMQTDWRLVAFIKTMRKDYGNVGKHMIKPFLDSYTHSLGISSIGLTTIGKIIKRRHFTFEERISVKRRLKFKKLRTKKSPHVTHPGFLQMDSIIVFVNHERHLFMSIMDIYTKYAFVVLVSSLSAKQATRVFQSFQQRNPTAIHTVQTDHGSEFLAGFHEYLGTSGIHHQFIYPNMPKINGCIERFNRTIQEECILRNNEIYYDLEAFQEKLVHYLQWYNEKRPHSSL